MAQIIRQTQAIGGNGGIEFRAPEEGDISKLTLYCGERLNGFLLKFGLIANTLLTLSRNRSRVLQRQHPKDWKHEWKILYYRKLSFRSHKNYFCVHKRR